MQINVLANMFQMGSNPALTAVVNIKEHQKPANLGLAGFFYLATTPNYLSMHKGLVSNSVSQKMEMKISHR